jgi:hypothetical protein
MRWLLGVARIFLWHACFVAHETQHSFTWLTIPDLVERLGVNQSRVRRLLEDNQLAAARVDGVLRVPSLFLGEDDAPLPELRGTIVLLHDSGFEGNDLVSWLIESEESLGTSPILALRAGRKAEVRRVAQALA